MKSVTMRLDGELSIYRAAALKDVLLAPLAAGSMIELDLAGVTEIDTAGLQLLMLAKNTALALGGDLRLSASSQPVLALLELLGLSATFGAVPAAPGVRR
jgi:anti-sigma B factor antagonist